LAGALELATGGVWSGTWDPTFFYSVERVKTENYPFSQNQYYWSLAVNEQSSSGGICDPAGNGDRILLYKACYMATSGCFDGPILRLNLPARLNTGQNTIHVDQVAQFPTTVSSASGVTVTAGGATALTDASGNATLNLATAEGTTVRATKATDVPAQSQVCIAPSGNNGLCGTVDKSPPATTIAIKDGQRFKKKGPRSLKGNVSDAGGVSKFELSLTARPTKRSGNCKTFNAEEAKFVKQKRCGATRGQKFAVDVKGGSWSYLLPKAPGKGRYVLDAIATDASGNKTLERVIFYVR
jgi:hypothetical protein